MIDPAQTSSRSLLRLAFVGLLASTAATFVQAAELPEQTMAFLDKHCSSCHNDVDKEGGLDLTTVAYTPSDLANFSLWVKVHDRVQAGEMPPKEKKRPGGDRVAQFCW